MATIYEQEMRKVEQIAEDHHREATVKKAVEAMKKSTSKHASSVVNTQQVHEIVTSVEDLPPEFESSIAPPIPPQPPVTPPVEKSKRPFSNLSPLIEPAHGEEEISSRSNTNANTPITSNVPFSNSNRDDLMDEGEHDYLGEALDNVFIQDESSHSRPGDMDLRGSFKRGSGIHPLTGQPAHRTSHYHTTSRSNHGMDHSNHSIQSAYSVASHAPATSMLEQDHTLAQWIRSSNVDFEKEEMESRKRSESFAHLVHQGAQHNYWDATTFLAGGGTAPVGQMKKRNSKGSLISSGNNNDSGSSVLSQLFNSVMGDAPLPAHSTHSTTSNATHDSVLTNEVRRASILSTMAKSVMQQRPSVSGTYASIPTNNEDAINPLHVVEEDVESPPETRPETRRSLSPPPPFPTETYGNYVEIEPPSIKTAAHKALNETSVHSVNTTTSFEPSQFPVRRFSDTALHPSQAAALSQGLQQRTESGGVSNVLPMLDMLTPEQLNEITKLSVEKARLATKQGWIQTKIAGTGAMKGIMELERTIEMVMLGAYYKYSSTAFVTFRSRVTESIAQQMLLSHDAMEINHAPNPKDVIWDNVAIPKSQVVLRNWITNAGIIVGSIFWSSLVNSVNVFATFFPLPQ